MQLIALHLESLKQGRPIKKPVYCRKEGASCKTVIFAPARFVVVEGEIALYRDFHRYVDFSIFIDSHWKTQLNTRIKRDIEERGYSPKKAIAAFLYSNLHEFSEYGTESKNWADVHIHCDEKYNMLIDAVCTKNAELMVDDVSAVLAGELIK
jgi:uridine kinase